MTPPSEVSAFVPTIPAVSSDRLGLRSSVSSLTITSTPQIANNQTGLVTGPKVNVQPFLQRCDTRPYPDGGIGKGTGTVVVLFRGDLRLHDHAALTHAIEEAATVIPVYVFDTRQFGASPAGFHRTGKYRAKFLVESVATLRKSLQKIGGNLIVRVGIPEKIVPEIARSTRAKRVFVHKEINVDELKVEMKLMETLKEQGIELKKFWSNTLYYEDDLPFRLSEMPDVYTDFRETVDKNSQVRDPLPAPESIPEMPKHLDLGKIPELSELGIHDTFGMNNENNTSGGVGTIVGGEVEALHRLRSFAEDRKHLTTEYTNEGGDGSFAVHTPDFACRISPWLALGCLSPRTIFNEMKRSIKLNSKIKKTYTYYELVWRDFFRCITAKYSVKRVGTKKSPVPV